MKKRYFLALLLLALAPRAPAQQPAQANLTAQAASCPTTGPGATTSSLIVRVQNTQGGYGINLSGTWSGTVSFFGATNGQTGWSALQVNPISGSTGVTTATANGNWQVNSAGLQGICVLVTTYSSGTVAASIIASNASARTNGGTGAGGSGTVTSVTFTGDGTVLSSTPSAAVTTSGTLTATLANQTANTVLGALTATTPSDLAMPSCSGATNGLIWTTGTGFGCNTFSASGANTALSNLSAVAVNTALLPGTDASISINSAAFRYVSFFASGTFAWTNGSGTADTAISRIGAGVIGAGTGAAGNTAGTFEATVFQGVNDGVHPGQVSFPGNTTLPSLTTNTVTIIGPPSATPTAWSLQLPTAIPTTTDLFSCVVTSTNCLLTDTGIASANVVTLAGSQTLTNKSISLTQINSGLTSGGVVCATSTTAISMTAALTSNVLPKGGGAGVCPTNSSITDNATTVTTTDTGGYVAPVFVANGTTAGFFDFPQGPTSAAVAPCNVATSICWQAPTAVTSYLTTLPGAAPDIASYKQTDGCAAAACTETFHPVPVLLTVASDFTDSTSTSLQLITGLSTTLPVSKAVVVSFHCGILFDQATAVVSDQFGIGVTGTAPTQANAGGEVFITASTVTAGTLTALASTTPTAVVTFTPGVATTIYRAELDGTIEQPSNATPGVLGIYVATTTGTDNIIVKRGTYCSVIYQ